MSEAAPTSTTDSNVAPSHADRDSVIGDSRRRRLSIALYIYLFCLAVYFLFGLDRLGTHSNYNHFAHLADAWLHGRHDLRSGAPSYAGNNDFAVFEGKTFISFPPFPALLMLPFVAIAGSPENFRDAQFVFWLAGIGPSALFLVLELLRREGRSTRTETNNVALALLFAFGTVYFFSAVQGTVWFAAHVVGVALMALFLLCAIGARRPALAGALLGCLFLTRVTTVLVGVVFIVEALRASGVLTCNETQGAHGSRVVARWCTDRESVTRFTKMVALFVLPLAGALLIASIYNHARFGTLRPWAFGHEYLTVGWQTRIRRWGLFHPHFLTRNLTVMWTSLPWLHAPTEAARQVFPFRISGHGLALWFTSPIYLWLFWPRTPSLTMWTALLGALGPLVANLLYQNSGWVQFGYRFSNDYAVLLFVMLAVNQRRLGTAFWAAAAWSVAWNTLGAVTFDRERYDALYSHDASAYLPPD